MICYSETATTPLGSYAFQTKLTYGMICYTSGAPLGSYAGRFQTKLTYGMICYLGSYAGHGIARD